MLRPALCTPIFASAGQNRRNTYAIHARDSSTSKRGYSREITNPVAKSQDERLSREEMREIDSSAYIKCLATSLASSISYVEFCNEAVVLRLLRVGLGLGIGMVEKVVWGFIGVMSWVPKCRRLNNGARVGWVWG